MLRFPHLVMTMTGITELWIIANMYLDFTENAHKYITDNEFINYIVLSTLAIVIISLVFIVHLADFRHSSFLYKVATLFCTILSAAWLMMFINASINEHFRILTPFLLYLASIKFLIAWYLGDAAKECKLE